MLSTNGYEIEQHGQVNFINENSQWHWKVSAVSNVCWKKWKGEAKCLAVGWLNYYVSLSSGNSSAVDSSSQSDGNSSSSSPTKVSAASPNFKAYKKNVAVNKLSILGMRFSHSLTNTLL